MKIKVYNAYSRIISAQYIFSKEIQQAQINMQDNISINHQVIASIIHNVLKSFKEISYECDSLVYSALEQESDDFIKLDIIIKQAMEVLIRYHSRSPPSQSCKTVKKQNHNVPMPKLPKKFQQIPLESLNQEVLQKCFQGIKDLIEIYNILSKVHKDKNQSMIHKCMQQFQNTFKCLQSSLSQYRSSNQSLTTILKQVLNEKLIAYTQYNLDSNIPSINNGPPQHQQSNVKQINIGVYKPLEFNGHLSEKSTIMIEDLKQQIQLLNHALTTTDKNYDFQIHRYRGKLIDLSETVNDLKQIIWNNERVYQHQTQILQTQIYEYKLLVRNMARKIRNYERSSTLVTESSGQISRSRQFMNSGQSEQLMRSRGRSRNYMCQRLSREKERIEHDRYRELNIADFKRSSSRKNRDILKYSTNSLSKRNII